MCFNNFFNAFIDKSSNEICYDFKVKKTIYIVIVAFVNKNVNKDIKAQFENLETIRFRYK